VLLPRTTREKAKPTNLVSYKSENFELVFAQEGGRLVGCKDLKYNRELITEEEKKLNLFPLEVFTGDPNIDLALNSEGYEVKVEGNRIRLSLRKENWSIEKVLEDKGNHFVLSVVGKNLPPVFVSSGIQVKEDDFYTHSGPVLKVGERVLRLEIKDIQSKELLFGDIKFAGVESRYYFKGFQGDISVSAVYRVGEKDSLILVRAEKPLNLYMGAKEYSRLKPLGLSDVLDYGSLKLLVNGLHLNMRHRALRVPFITPYFSTAIIAYSEHVG